MKGAGSKTKKVEENAKIVEKVKVEYILIQCRRLFYLSFDNMLFSNYKFTSNQREAFLIDSFSLYPCCLKASKVKMEIKSRLHCININAYHCSQF